jgi:hypothetical protein
MVFQASKQYFQKLPDQSIQLCQQFRIRRSFCIGIDHIAFRVNQDKARNRIDPICFDKLRIPVVIGKKLRSAKVFIGHEFFPFLVILFYIDGNTHELDVFPFVFLFCFLQEWNFSTTRSAPRCPGIDINVFAFQLG